MSELRRHEPLYLKYRPQSLNQLVGQQAVARTLSNAINSNRISHAYLFTGPRGTGKTSSARILAKSLNCEHGPTPEPCLACTPCQEIKIGSSPAVFEIDAASNNSVDDARVLIERAPLVAVGGRFKLYIIDECHMLTKEAFNALLKTIEEPPPNVIFILATTEEHKVPPTIVSRCQRLMFRLVGQEDLVKHLRSVAEQEHIEIEEQALELIARRSGGGLRDALGLIDQASLLGSPGQPVNVSGLLGLLGAVHEDVLLEISSEVSARQGHQVLALTNRLLTEGREPSVIAVELARHFLSLTKASYLVETGKSDPTSASSFIIGSQGYIAGLLEQAGRFDRAELSQIVEQLDRLEQTCRRSSQPALNLEMGLLAICHRHDILIVRDLAQRLQALEAAVSGGAPLPAPATTAHSAQPVARPVHAFASLPQSTAPSAQPAASSSQPAAPPASVPVENPPGQAAAAAQQSTETGASVEQEAPPEVPAASEAPAYAMQPLVNSALPAPSQLQPQPAAATSVPPQHSGATPSAPGPAQPLPAAQGQAEQITMDNAEEDAFDLDQFWSQLLDQLQKVNIPAYSVLSEHAFPVGLTSKDCTIGVLTEHFQNTVERRIEKIKVACEAVLGRSVVMKVKIVTEPNLRGARGRDEGPRTRPEPEHQAVPMPVRTAGKEYQSAGADNVAAGAEPATADEEPEPARPRLQGAEALPVSTQRTAPVAAGSRPDRAADSLDSAEEGGPRVVSGKAASSALSDKGDGFDARTVRDAYKIFEGPGSRLIV